MILDTLDYGDTAAVKIIVKDQSGAQMTGFPIQNFVLASSDPRIAEVDQGAMTVVGVGLGDATITARYGDLEASGVLPVRLGYAPAQKLTAGSDHTCILDDHGAAWCWGGGSYGRLGDGNEKDAAHPVAVAGGHSFSSIVAGYFHTCAIENRSTWCWGYGLFGALGSDTTQAAVPVKVSGVPDFVQLAAGESYTCGLVYGGLVFCWGFGESGQLGRGEIGYSATSAPGMATVTAKFARISASGAHTCALTRLGKAYCWGEGWMGGLGTGDNEDKTVPTAVVDTLTFVDIVGGYGHTCGVDRDGRTFCWGYNEHGEIGRGTASAAEMSPVRVQSSESFSVVSQGRAGHLCGIGASDERVYCWGYNANGQVGDGSMSDALAPRQIGTLVAKAVAAGFSHTCAVDTQNRVFCWGMNVSGQVGNGTFGADVLTPSQMDRFARIAF